MHDLRRCLASARSRSCDDLSLPAWAYHNPDALEAERCRIFRKSWQIVCHVSDVSSAGDWQTLYILGESIVVVRGDDALIRAFSNVCRHRGARIVNETSGCARKLVCPYHAWVYELDGRLSGVPMRGDYPSLHHADHSLVALPIEIWRGFIFVAIEQPSVSVAEMMAPHEAEIAPYRFEDMRAIGRITTRPRPANWKNISDNYSDALHIPVAHPGLKRLFGAKNYGVHAGEWVDRLGGPLVEAPDESPSERAYRQILPRVDHLPADRQRVWFYYKLWPNTAFDIYPDQMDFMQFLPISPTETMIREIAYAIPDGRRVMRAARYLNWRINRLVSLEDSNLVERVQAGMASASFTQGLLGESEVCLRQFAKRMRAIVPEMELAQPPAPGWGRR